ncbi:hypothetical protein [Noviherbaspirillum album]|uniref:hypothetical protein n=1 Tax=Noviherbaspirillum album TaxID=3080276 RepID=UPI002DD6B192|nr:hypothetical protein [Noviherbaspirillum sp. CPCC 100848]
MPAMVPDPWFIPCIPVAAAVVDVDTDGDAAVVDVPARLAVDAEDEFCDVACGPLLAHPATSMTAAMATQVLK